MFGYQVLGFGAGGGKKSFDLHYMIIAGGGAGGNGLASGGGAGGFRLSFGSTPLSSQAAVTVDGGVNNENAKICKENGADVLAVGSFLLSKDQNIYNEIINSLR